MLWPICASDTIGGLLDDRLPVTAAAMYSSTYSGWNHPGTDHR